MPQEGLLLAIDTCGPSGSVALGRQTGSSSQILGQKELAGRSYSATLITAVAELLQAADARLANLRAIIAVHGPGSFTGVRVCLSAVKGLAEAPQIPVVAVSRLQVLAAKAGCASAALDAHRGEVFLRLAEPGKKPHELLAGAEELAALHLTASPIAVCDDAGARVLAAAWPGVDLLREDPPTAADALTLCADRVLREEFVDLALLDGHYLRRSDAEIFGEKAAAGQDRA